MSGLYDKDGNYLSSVYNKNGNPLSIAYDKDGSAIWSAEPVTLRVANYNVGDWGTGAGAVPTEDKDAYLALQNAIFTAVDADICCMQEWSATFCADGTQSSVVTSEYFDSVYSSGVWAIGANIPLTGFEAIPYTSVSATGDYAKYEKAYFTVNGKTVCLINCHLALTKATAIAQAAELIEAVDGEQYYIIMGDLNTAIGRSWEDYHEATDYETIVKQFLDVGMNSANLSDWGWLYTYYSTADYTQSGSATDHIFTSPNITIQNAFVDTTKLTDGLADKIDHIPLVADLIIG